ncbi:hypothetical protein [Nonomuraea diastatica]|uniref:Uncharacterized protein n=1 Tax=Nonomuraea diastatica TaxID=1848329 RepID=A0A4R4X3G9_9ACTN|nr:hypothetical protein [Nonomuraea diastatica]TDD24793.1 hypothetical protein E1294_05035 [Nonomuraea diastatica]
MRLAGGLALALAAASALAGSSLAIAAGIAVVIAFLATLIPESPYDGYPKYEVRRVTLSQVIVNLPLIAVYASTFGVYVVPEYSKIASAGLVLLVAVLTSGWHMDLIRPLRTMVLAALAFGAFVLITASFNVSPEDIRQGESRPWWGVALAAVALVPMLVPTPGSSRRSRLGRFALALPIAAVICVGAVYQLGTELAPTFLKDLLIATELHSSSVALVALIGAATVAAAIDVWSDAKIELSVLILDSSWHKWAGVLATAAAAAFVPPVVLMILAGAAVIINAVIWWHIGYVYIKYSSYP